MAASTLDSYKETLDRLQTIITSEDVPAIYIGQPKWTTVLQQGIEGFAFNPINMGTYDFWKMSRSA